MDPEQARTEYFELFNKIQALAPGDWGVAPPSEFQGDACRLPDGTDGTQFSVNTSRSPLSREEMDALHEKVKEQFVTTGFTVQQSTDGGENFVRRTTVSGPEKFVMGITTGKYGIALSGNTRCVPGSSGEGTAPSTSQTTATNTLPEDGKGATMTPEEARTEFFGLLDEIQAMAAGDWVNEDVPAGGYCNFQGTGNGKEFGGSRTRDPLSVTDREVLRQKVEEFYKSRGYSVKVFDQSTATNKLIITNGFGPDGLVLQVYTGDLGTTVAGNSRCVPDPQGSK
ncbi:MAG: hypothetical protein WB535_00640 [Paenarthrobacter sp.]